ncbi:lantibiotic dehydratase [Micromonospora sp. NPDC005220]|uniref:lantibiotic dehydratase n=1 Tax=Micromonospora sp. NPDC005220 TaxID=3155589 RepID=UPI0033B3AA41
MTVSLPARAATPVSWRMPRVFMLRTAGLPLEVADRLAFDETAAWARGVLERERRLDAAGRELADALQAAVARNRNDGRLRQSLIRLRRDVFNRRRPRGDDAATASPEALGPDTHAALRRWLTDLGEYEVERSRGGAVLDAELATGRAVLRTLADHPGLRGGIQLASPSLDAYLPDYLARSASGAEGKRTRRMERSLLEYAYRTACKTSPFSRLTTVNVGSLTDSGGGLLDVRPTGEIRGSARLNLAALGRLSAIVLADEKLCADLPVAVTTGWRIDRGRLRYLRRRRTSSDDGDAAVTLESIHESLFMLPTGQVLHDILAALDGGRAPRLADLVAELATDGRPDADIEVYLRHLLRVGLLVVPNLHLDIHADDPVEGYRRALREIGQDWSDRLAERVAAANGLVTRFPDEDIAGRRRLLADIRAQLVAAHTDLGRAEVPVPRTLVYEDTSMRTRTPVVADRGRWESDIVPGLRALARIMPVFDINLPRRLATKGFFLARHGAGGRCDDLLTFAHEFQQDFFEHYSGRMMRRRAFDADNRYVRQENWFRQEEITALDDARVEMARRVNEAYAALPPDAEELVLDDTVLADIAARVPDTLGVLDPRSFFLQLADQGERRRVVVNRVYSGMTLLFSRFAHLFADERLADTLRTELSLLQPPGAVLCELKGGYDATNLNLHPAVTPYELVCPGEVSFRPAAEQIHLDDLSVEHDAATDRLLLRSRRLDAEVIPVYLGFLLPMALPEVQQVLLTFAHVGMAQPDLWAGTSVPLPGRGMVGYPRIVHGDLVLQRRMWKLHPEHLPAPRAAAAGAADWFLDWQRWRRDNGLPRRVFATPEGGPAAPADGDDTRPAGKAGGRPDHKPLYVDFDSHFSLELLEATARGAGSRLVLTEMLPGRDEQILRDPTGTYVTELTVELNGVRDGKARP